MREPPFSEEYQQALSRTSLIKNQTMRNALVLSLLKESGANKKKKDGAELQRII